MSLCGDVQAFLKNGLAIDSVTMFSEHSAGPSLSAGWTCLCHSTSWWQQRLRLTNSSAQRRGQLASWMAAPCQCLTISKAVSWPVAGWHAAVLVHSKSSLDSALNLPASQPVAWCCLPGHVCVQGRTAIPNPRGLMDIIMTVKIPGLNSKRPKDRHQQQQASSALGWIH